MKRVTPGLLATLWIVAFGGTVLAAPLGTAFTYQGQLKDGGSPANGLFTMVFRLFDAGALGNEVAPPLVFDGGVNPQVSVAEGLFTVELDFFSGAYSGERRWLEITVNGTPLSPRQELMPTPYAHFAAAPWEPNGAHIYYNVSGGNVGIGTVSPTRKLHVNSLIGAADIRVSSASSQAAIYLDSDGSGNAAMYSPDNTDDLRFYVGAADRLHIGADGNIGIGTNTPLARLDVMGTSPGSASDDQQQIIANNNDKRNQADGWQSITAGATGYLTRVLLRHESPTGAASVQGTLRVYLGEGTGGTLVATQSTLFSSPFGTYPHDFDSPPYITAGQVFTIRYTVASTTHAWMGYDNSGDLYAPGRSDFSATRDYAFVTTVAGAQGQSRLFVGQNRVGIGTANPQKHLDVAGHANISANLDVGGSLDVSGNVGIGTDAPTQKLQVVGSVLANGMYHSTGSIHGNDAARLKSGGAGHSVSVKTEPSGAITIWNDNIGNFKSFIINHPDDTQKYLVHVAIEGPEVAVFYRGSAQLKEGAARIELPAYFESLTDPDGRTIQITNVDGFDRLAVRSRNGAKIVNGAFEVCADNARSSQAFDWEVKARRRDGKALVVEPNRSDIEVRGDGPYKYYSVPRAQVTAAVHGSGGAR